MFKHESDSVFLNGIRVPLHIFLQLEPSYNYPNDLVVMFYDGARRHYRTKFKSWTLWGKWNEGDRYLSRIDEFSALMQVEKSETAEAIQEVSALKKKVLKAKYPVEDTNNVELHKRDDLDKGGTEGVRSEGKRVSRSGSKRSGRATRRSSE